MSGIHRCLPDTLERSGCCSKIGQACTGRFPPIADISLMSAFEPLQTQQLQLCWSIWVSLNRTIAVVKWHSNMRRRCSASVTDPHMMIRSGRRCSTSTMKTEPCCAARCLHASVAAGLRCALLGRSGSGRCLASSAAANAAWTAQPPSAGVASRISAIRIFRVITGTYTPALRLQSSRSALGRRKLRTVFRRYAGAIPSR